jgi:integrase
VPDPPVVVGGVVSDDLVVQLGQGLHLRHRHQVDQADRLAAGRRQRRVDATPAPFRPAVEAFLAQLPRARKRRLTVLRQFFRAARLQRIVLADPTRGLSAKPAKGFIGQTLTLPQQRALFRRWTADATTHPHEALLGILALLHGASSVEVRLLRRDHVDTTNRTIRLGRRPQPVQLDPTTWAVLQRCLAHRETQRTDNPHVVVTRGTKAGNAPASTAYFSHLLDACGISPRTLRNTRLVGMVNTLDPKLVAAAFGMNPQGVLAHLADHVWRASNIPDCGPNRFLSGRETYRWQESIASSVLSSVTKRLGW